MSFACHLHVICMRSYFLYMYSLVIRMSVVCTRMSLVCTRMSLVLILWFLSFCDPGGLSNICGNFDFRIFGVKRWRRFHLRFCYVLVICLTVVVLVVSYSFSLGRSEVRVVAERKIFEVIMVVVGVVVFIRSCWYCFSLSDFLKLLPSDFGFFVF